MGRGEGDDGARGCYYTQCKHYIRCKSERALSIKYYLDAAANQVSCVHAHAPVPLDDNPQLLGTFQTWSYPARVHDLGSASLLLFSVQSGSSLYPKLRYENAAVDTSALMRDDSVVLLLNVKVINGMKVIQPQLVVNSFHPSSVFGGKSRTITTKVDVQLFQRLILGFGHDQPYEKSSTASKAGEEDVCPKSHAIDHVTCCQSYDKVELGTKSARVRESEMRC